VFRRAAGLKLARVGVGCSFGLSLIVRKSSSGVQITMNLLLNLFTFRHDSFTDNIMNNLAAAAAAAAAVGSCS